MIVGLLVFYAELIGMAMIVLTAFAFLWVLVCMIEDWRGPSSDWRRW